MTEYTREEILKLIEENDGPEGLDLSGKDLSGIDLGREAIAAELEKARKIAPDEIPVWYSKSIKGLNLAGANLQVADLKDANLQGAELWGANLQGAKLDGANLRGAILALVGLHEAKLWGAKLQGAVLWAANLQEADLRVTDLKEADLMEANLQGAHLSLAFLQGANLSYSHLEKADFSGAESEGAYFYSAFLDNTRMRKEQLGGAIGEELEGKYDEAKEAYLALKNNFAEVGRYRDESWAYIKERQMGKMMHHPRLAREYYGEDLPENPKTWQLGFYIRHTARWALDRVEEWTCDYGESVPKTLRAMGVTLVGFAVLYYLLDALVDASGNPSSGWLHCLLYSGGAFTTFGVDTLKPANDWIRALSIFESGVGIALTGLLGFVLGNRIRRS